MSKISFFNPTVFKRNTKSYWPVWAVYLFIMLLAVPTVATDAGVVEIQQRMLNTAKSASVITGFLYAPTAAMAVFSYMYNQRLAGGTAALPIRRETQFLTDVLSIIIWSVGVHVITAVMTVLVTNANLNAYAGLSILKWLVNGILNTLFFIGLAAFCSQLTGNMFILPCIYIAFNFIVIGLYTLGTSVFEAFLLGFGGASYPKIIMAFTPVVEMFGADRFFAESMYIYAAVGIALIIAALLLAKHHKAETATDVVAIQPLKPVARYCIAVCCAFALGLLLHEILFWPKSSIGSYIICFIVGAFIGYFASEMLIRKSFRVFDKWPGFVALAVVLTAFFICVDVDIFGYETYIPKTDEVRTVQGYINGNNFLSQEKDTIELVRGLHSEMVHGNKNAEEYSRYGYIKITYTLENGNKVTRFYEGMLPNGWEEIFDTYETKLNRVLLPDGYTPEDFAEGRIEWIDECDTEYALNSTEITQEQFTTLYELAISECAVSDIGTILFADNRIQVYAELTKPETDFDGEAVDSVFGYSLTIPENAERCTEYIKSIIGTNTD